MKKIFIVLLCVLSISLCSCATSSTKTTSKKISLENGQAEKQIKTKTYIENGITYKLPEEWKKEKGDSGDLKKFIRKGNKKDILLIKAEDVPAIMKVDLGDGKNVEDKIVDSYSVADLFKAKKSSWKTYNKIKYYEEVYKYGVSAIVFYGNYDSCFRATFYCKKYKDYYEDLKTVLESLKKNT